MNAESNLQEMKQTNIKSTRLPGKASHRGGAFQLGGKIQRTCVDLTHMLSGGKSKTLNQEMQALLFLGGGVKLSSRS